MSEDVKPGTIAHIERLPAELLIHVARYLSDDDDVLALAQVSRRLRPVCAVSFERPRLIDQRWRYSVRRNDFILATLLIKARSDLTKRLFLTDRSTGAEKSAKRPLLEWAFHFQSFAVARALIRAGADKLGSQIKPFHRFIDVVHQWKHDRLLFSNVTSMIELLVKNGFSLNEREDGLTPLEYILKRHEARPTWLWMSYLLIRQEAEIPPTLPPTLLHNMDPPSESLSPSHAERLIAMHVDLIKMLKSKGSDLDTRNSLGQTPLMVAVKSTHINKSVILQFLEEGVSIHAQDKHGHSILHMARADLMEILVEHKADLEACNQNGDTPLMHFARQWKSGEEAEKLIEQGAKPQTRSNSGDTILHVATGKRNHEFLSKIVTHKWVDINVVNNEGRTPLHLALMHESLDDMVPLLLDGGADVNKQDYTSRRPLHVASRVKDVKSLLKFGADPSLALQDVKEALFDPSWDPKVKDAIVRAEQRQKRKYPCIAPPSERKLRPKEKKHRCPR